MDLPEVGCGAWIGSSWLWIKTESSTYGGEERHIQGFDEEPEGKRLIGGSRQRWEDNIKMDLQEVRCVGMDWIELALDRDRT